MARTTFGRTGKPIQVIDSDPQHDLGEVRQATVIDDNPGAVPNFTVIAGDSDGDASDEVRSDPSKAGEPIRPGYTTYTDPRTGEVRQRRKRGTANTRPRSNAASTGTASPGTNTAFVTANLEKVLFNLHTMASGLLRDNTWEITKEEAAILAEAVKEVAESYNFAVISNPKVAAWVDFAIAFTVVYGQRIKNTFMTAPAPKPVTIIPPQPAPPHRHSNPPAQPITVMEAFRETHGGGDLT